MANVNLVDSSSIKINQNSNNIKLDIDFTYYTLTPNNNYVYSTDLEYICVKIGNLVILNINTMAFSASVDNNFTTLFSGLPPSITGTIGYLIPNDHTYDLFRVRITDSGTLINHWANPNKYGNSSGFQYSGIIMYFTS